MQAVGQDAQVPLFNAQLDMDSREQINEALTTGVKVCAMLRIEVTVAGLFSDHARDRTINPRLQGRCKIAAKPNLVWFSNLAMTCPTRSHLSLMPRP